MVLVATVACDGGPVAGDPPGGEGADTDTGADSAHDTSDSDVTGDTADADTAGDADADGDGWTPNAGDCDDTLAHVHPGAPDYCDGLDADCDGEPIPDGSCSEPGDPAAMWRWSFEGSKGHEGGVDGPMGDIDADGRSDIAVDLRGGLVGPLTGARLEELPPSGPYPPLAWDYEFPRWGGGSPYAAGDIDGNGIDDAWVTSVGSDLYRGGLFLFLGRVGGFPNDGARIDLAADAMWTDDASIRYPGFLDAGDLDGDGLQDAAIYLTDPDFTADGFDIYWAVVPGAAGPTGETELASLPRLALQYDTTLPLGGGRVQIDMDGDGIDEVAHNTQRKRDGWQVFTVVEGEDLWADGSILDVGHDAWYQSSGTNDSSFGLGVSGPVGDIDGDGRGDLVLNFGEDGEAVDSMLLFASGGVPHGSINDLVYATVSSDAGDTLYAHAWTDDLDNDGARDFVAGRNCLLPSSKIREGGQLDLADVGGPCFYPDGSSSLIAAATDMTGDGHPEWIFNEFYWVPPEGGIYEYNRALIIEGFAIPWDDPTKW